MRDEETISAPDAWEGGHFDGYMGQRAWCPIRPTPELARAYREGYLAGRRARRREAAEVRRLRHEWAGVPDGLIPF